MNNSPKSEQSSKKNINSGQESDNVPQYENAEPLSDPVATAQPASPVPQQSVQPVQQMQYTQLVQPLPRVESSYARSLKNIILKALLGATVVAAVVTVILILIGSWNDATWRALWTIVIAVLHLVFVLGIASTSIYARNERSVRSNNVVLNTILGIVVMSFFVAILGTWSVLSGAVVADFYTSFVVMIFAALHAKILYDTTPTAVNAGVFIGINYGVIALLSVLIILWSFVPGVNDVLNGFYGRLVAATVVVNVTLSIVIAVMRRFYMQSHPEVRQHSDGMSSGMIAIIVIVSTIALWVLPAILSVSGGKYQPIRSTTVNMR